MNRRKFLQTTAAAALPALLLPATLLRASEKKAGKPQGLFTILHTNDTHARIDPFPDTHPKLGGLGGIARRAKAVAGVRATQPHTLLLDAGDIFQGTPYFNFYKGELDLELMTGMGYEASTLGNHEFDLGVDGFCSSAKKAGFPFLNANYDLGTSPIREFVKPYHIKEFNGLRIGIFGVGIDLSGLVLPSTYPGIRYQDPVEPARKMAQYLRKTEKCHFVVCLSHLGYAYESEKISDCKLAESVPGIDLILGGHTHTFLEKPYIVDRGGDKTVVTQVGWGGVILGRIDIAFNGDGRITTLTQANTELNATFA